MLDFLPSGIANCIYHLNVKKLYELRVRAQMPLRANYNGEYVLIGNNGIVVREKEAYFPTIEEIEELVFVASGYSVYAVENQIRQGFITGNCGERIGLAGIYVYENNRVLSVRNFTSICIRIPHEIYGCAEKIYCKCLQDKLCSLLIMSPPGVGKTTVLRELSRVVSQKKQINILVADERGELSAGDLGNTSDCIKFAEKETAFTAGIRAMRPDLIVTDELLPKDFNVVKDAMANGIFVFASAHLTNYKNVPLKIFSYYVILSGLGNVLSILDKDGNELD